MVKEHYESRLRDLHVIKKQGAATAILWISGGMLNYTNVVKYALDGLVPWAFFSCVFGAVFIGLGVYYGLQSLNASHEAAALKGALAQYELKIAQN